MDISHAFDKFLSYLSISFSTFSTQFLHTRHLQISGNLPQLYLHNVTMKNCVRCHQDFMAVGVKKQRRMVHIFASEGKKELEILSKIITLN